MDAEEFVSDREALAVTEEVSDDAEEFVSLTVSPAMYVLFSVDAEEFVSDREALAVTEEVSVD